ncbi:lactate dehydrogenase [Pedobacter immunditicola]|uniref:lactate dehydrogenase n=1 Tax=Pedobacter immunditicola TaxID=3133440 RepID=UPI0030B55FBF
MRAVAYSIKSYEKEPLAIANRKKHEITLISNSLTEATAAYAEGKEAVIVLDDDEVNAGVINKLADMGVKYIATRSTSIGHIDLQAAEKRHIKIANVPAAAVSHPASETLYTISATETIRNLDQWQEKKCLGNACICSKTCRSQTL